MSAALRSPDREITATARRLSAAAGETALMFDFDGVLAPIVPDPVSARPLPGVRDALAACVGRYARVAIVTGREPDWIDAIFGLDGLEIVGSHGMERHHQGRVEAHPLVAAWRTPIAEFADRAEAALAGEEGVWVERKAFTLSVHYRGAPDTGAARAAIDAAAAPLLDELDLRGRHGRRVLEVRPPVEVSKGTAAAGLVDDPRVARAMFAGDDTTDLDAFAALRRLAAQGALTEVVLVGAADPEADPRVAAEADLVVDGPAGLAAFLALLAEPA